MSALVGSMASATRRPAVNESAAEASDQESPPSFETYSPPRRSASTKAKTRRVPPPAAATAMRPSPSSLNVGKPEPTGVHVVPLSVDLRRPDEGPVKTLPSH